MHKCSVTRLLWHDCFHLSRGRRTLVNSHLWKRSVVTSVTGGGSPEDLLLSATFSCWRSLSGSQRPELWLILFHTSSVWMSTLTFFFLFQSISVIACRLCPPHRVATPSLKKGLGQEIHTWTKVCGRGGGGRWLPLTLVCDNKSHLKGRGAIGN